MTHSIITPEAKAKYGYGAKIQAEDVVIGQKIRVQEPYDREVHEGIVVGITRYPGDPVGHVSFELWDWDHIGLDDFSIWEVNLVEVL